MALTSLYVFLGGGLGALSRFGLSLASVSLFKTSIWGTLLVNIIGACALYTLSEKVSIDHKALDIGIKTGLLGGLTTFSTFSYEVFKLVNEQKMLMACGHFGLNIVFGIIIMVIIFR